MSRALGKGWRERLQFLGFSQEPDKVVKALKSHICLPHPEDSFIRAADENRGLSQAEALAQSHTAGPQNGNLGPTCFLAQMSRGHTLPHLRPTAGAKHPS